MVKTFKDSTVETNFLLRYIDDQAWSGAWRSGNLRQIGVQKIHYELGFEYVNTDDRIIADVPPMR